MLRCCGIATLLLLLWGCGKKQSPIVGDWSMRLGGKAAPMARSFTMSASFEPDGTIVAHTDFDVSMMVSPGSPKTSKPSWIHETYTGKYFYENGTLTIRMYEQQTRADDPSIKE